MGLKFHPNIVYFLLDPPGADSSFKLSRFCDKDVCDNEELSLGDWFSLLVHVVHAFVEPCR